VAGGREEGGGTLTPGSTEAEEAPLCIFTAMRVLVLGAGFGGLELSTRLSDEFGEVLDIVLIDKNEGFVFGFSKLDVMFGRKNPSEVFHSYGDLEKPGLRFVQTTIRSIDPVTEHVETDSGAFDADIIVVAPGADLDPSATPGLIEASHEFYTVPAPSLCVMCCPRSTGVMSSSASPRLHSSVHRPE
jgi:NADPH-dependent 2,4-dienoyl-CoA reductase/sulfur reductase-like enzyme